MMTRAEAEKYREELMAERTVSFKGNDNVCFEMVRTHSQIIFVRLSPPSQYFDMWYIPSTFRPIGVYLT